VFLLRVCLRALCTDENGVQNFLTALWSQFDTSSVDALVGREAALRWLIGNDGCLGFHVHTRSSKYVCTK
jgi:hypothetical protein